jgi:hypothetical protein
VDGIAFGPGNAGVGDEDIEAVVEFCDLGGDGFVYGVGVRDVDLVCFA